MIREAWASYREQVMPAEADQVQVEESRLAFYAGATAVYYGIMRAMSRAPWRRSTDLSPPSGGKLPAAEQPPRSAVDLGNYADGDEDDSAGYYEPGGEGGA